VSETGREAAGEWRRSFLGLAVAAIVILSSAAAADATAWQVAGLAAAFILGIGVYLAWPRDYGRRAAGLSAPARTPAGLPEAARELLECVGDPLLVLDSAGRVLFANRASRAIVAADADRKHITAVLRTPQLIEAIERILAGGEAETVAFSIPVPVLRHYEAYMTRTLPAHAPAAALLMQIRDLTAVRRGEELRADFVANASHELRTPLAAVTGFIDTLKGHARNDPEARDRFLEIMSVEAGRMRRLIEDLLSLTRIELNEHNPPSGEIDVVALVKAVAEALAPLAQADRITITIACHPPLMVVGERDELTQLFQNLIHNAIKYGRDAGQVRVTFGQARAQGRREGLAQAFVSIQDEGEGIPREAIPRLTERFYRLDVKRSRERGGTGLGLAIVKHILNRHQGRLQVESKPGVGSTFTVFLPAAAGASPE
jgi:two-component system, OmpR family, phosphate regulon sensor histidine kinase PhoR